MSENKKRKGSNPHSGAQSNKKSKSYRTITGIETGAQGIFATCDRGREPKCVAELYELLEQCASKLYGLESDGNIPGGIGSGEDEEDEDIQASIEREISSLRENSRSRKLFVNVKLDLNCVVFFHIKAPCIPTEMVHALLEGKVQSRWIHRLTPVTRAGKATLEGLEEVAKEVLGPHFHEGQDGVKFAIRPTTRNHSLLNRDQVIKLVADIVGPNHKVDLKNYDVLILVDIYKNMCGMSVVRDFEKFKKYNLQETQKDSETKEDIKGGG